MACFVFFLLRFDSPKLRVGNPRRVSAWLFNGQHDLAGRAKIRAMHAPSVSDSFDAEKICGLYAGSGSEIEELASMFANAQSLMAKSFLNLEGRIKALRSVCSSFETFGVNVSHEPSTQEAADQIGKQVAHMSNESLHMLCKCVCALDRMLHQSGRLLDERTVIAQSTFETCVVMLPPTLREQIEPQWRQHWEQVVLLLASKPWDETASKPRIRI